MTFGRSTRSLLVVANWRDASHPDAGGAEAVCEGLAREFAARGLDVVYLTSAVAGSPMREQRDGYTVIRHGGRFTVYARTLAWLFRHRHRIRGVVDSQNGIPFFVPLVLPHKTPVVLLIHHVHQEQFAAYFPPAVAFLGRRLEGTVSRWVYRDRAVVTVSPSTRRGVRRQLKLRGDIVVAAPGVSEVFDPEATRSGRSRHERIVCVGRLVPHKRVAMIVGAMPALLERFPRLEVHIVGDGSERARLQQLVASLGLGRRVVVHGELGREDRDRLLATAWMSVIASSGEGWGLTVVEANALGVPVLAYRTSGLRDSIRDGETGWLLDDGADLTAGIGAALEQLADPEEADVLSARARQWAARFTWDAMADQLLDALASEADRLDLSVNRRVSNDVATVVHIPLEAIPESWRPSFRRNDKWDVDEQGVSALLRGADLEAAHVALRRCGLPETNASLPSLQLSVARPIDLISPGPIRDLTVVARAVRGVSASG